MDSTAEFRDTLKKYVAAIFRNEDKFLNKFFPHVDTSNYIHISSFYMAGSSCRVEFTHINSYGWKKEDRGINTQEYLDWVEELNNKQQ